MTKKDYELIANVLSGRLNNYSHLEKFGYSQKEINMANTVIKDTIDFMTYELARENPKFDRAKFLTACGIKITQ